MNEHPTFSRPTPWAVHDDGDAVISVIDAEKTFLFGWTRSVESMFLARDIVAAVNEHAALVSQRAELLAACEEASEWLAEHVARPETLRLCRVLEAAIRNAKAGDA